MKNTASFQMLNMFGLMCGMVMCGMAFGVEKTSDDGTFCLDKVK